MPMSDKSASTGKPSPESWSADSSLEGTSEKMSAISAAVSPSMAPPNGAQENQARQKGGDESGDSELYPGMENLAVGPKGLFGIANPAINRHAPLTHGFAVSPEPHPQRLVESELDCL